MNMVVKSQYSSRLMGEVVLSKCKKNKNPRRRVPAGIFSFMSILILTKNLQHGTSAELVLFFCTI